MKFASTLKNKNFEELLKNGEIDLFYQNSRKQTLFIYTAANEKYTNQLSLILRYHKSKVENQTYTHSRNALHVAVENSNITGVSILLEGGFNPNQLPHEIGQERPIITASKKNNLPIVKLLVEYGARVNEKHANQITPLRNAIKNKNLEMVRYLVVNNANVNVLTSLGSALRMSLYFKQDEIAMFLYEKGASLLDISSVGDSALHEAAKHGKLETVKYFSIKQQNIDLKSDRGDTPLLSACRWGKCQNADYLISLEANIHAYNYEEETALFLALCSGNLELVQLLIKKGCNLEKEMEKINANLFYRISHTKIVDFLLNNGANINVKNKEGQYIILLRFTKTLEQIGIINKHHNKMELQLLNSYRDNSLKYLVLAN